MPQLPLLVLAVARSSLHRGSGSGVSGEIGGRRPGVPSRADPSADLPEIFLAVKAFAMRCDYIERERIRMYGMCVEKSGSGNVITAANDCLDGTNTVYVGKK